MTVMDIIRVLADRMIEGVARGDANGMDMVTISTVLDLPSGEPVKFTLELRLDDADEDTQTGDANNG